MFHRIQQRVLSVAKNFKNTKSIFRSYSDQVNQHFNKPKNVGTLDKNDPNVGTGLVGAPACFHGDTLVVLAQSYAGHHKYISLQRLFEATNEGRELVKVWSFNPSQNLFEPKLARVICTGIKEMDELAFSNQNNLRVTVTPDHQFLYQTFWNQQCTQVTYEYVGNNEPTTMMQTILPFNAEHGCRIAKRKFVGAQVAFTLQVEENNNYVVVTNIVNELFNGIVVKNCGDVMKLQIKVDDDGKIIDSKIKVFGCVAGDSLIWTPSSHYKPKPIRSLQIGDTVYAYNGCEFVENQIEKIHTFEATDELLQITFDNKSEVVCTKDHIWWTADNKPIEAVDIEENVTGLMTPTGSVVATKKEVITDFKGITLYDIKLKEGANVYFINSVASHNCGSAISSSSLASELIKDKHLDEATKITNQDIAKALSLPPVKLHCSMLAEDAIKAAVEDIKRKKALNKDKKE